MPYSIQPEPGPGGSLIVVTGDADLSAASELEAMVTAAVAGGETSVIIDLSDATLVDSRTIAVLVEWTEKLSSSDGSLGIICTNANILRLLARIGLDRTLAVYPNRDEAQSGGA